MVSDIDVNEWLKNENNQNIYFIRNINCGLKVNGKHF